MNIERYTMNKEIQQYYSSYNEDKISIKKIDSLLVNVIKIFYNFYDEKICWAYEIKDGDEEFNKSKSLSHSTCSMILHSILSALGKLPKSYISKGIDSKHYLVNNDRIKNELIDKKKLVDELEKISKKCFSKLIEKRENLPLFFKSNTFGENDPFTYAWFLEFFLFYDQTLSQEEKDELKFGSFKEELVDTAIEKVKKAFKGISKGTGCLDWGDQNKNPTKKSLEHSFPFLKIINIYQILESFIEQITSNDEKSKKEFQEFDRRISRYTLNNVHKYLSLHEIKDSDFDVAELVFNLEAYLLSVPKEKPIDKNLLEKVFSTVEDRQKMSPYWRPLKPFVTTDAGFVLLPLSIEIVNSLLRICSVVEERDGDNNFFYNYIEIFKRYLSWLDNRVVIGEAVGCNKDTCKFVGWHSENILESGKISPWDTSQVLVFMLLYKSHMQKYISKKMMESSNFVSRKYSKKDDDKNDTPHDYWKKVWEKKEPLLDKKITSSKYKVLKNIGDEFIRPRNEGNLLTGSEDINCSMLLYGPAGTGKSTIAEEIAKSLKWGMITITPSNFIAKGESEVENKATEIFNSLMEQEKQVVLFDEIDRLILDRDSGFYQNQSDIFQFMTPGMLVKIKDLRRKQNLIFIIATNYEDRIDPAIKRSGRIDRKYLIMPPDFDQRKQIMKNRIKDIIKNNYPNLFGKIKNDDIDTLITGYNIKEIFCKKTVFYKFGELDDLAGKIAKNLDATLETGDKTSIIKCLKKELEKSDNYEQPELTLRSYENRFKSEDNKDKFPQVQEPFLEFLILVFLKLNEQCKEKGRKTALNLSEEKLFTDVVQRIYDMKDEASPEEKIKKFSDANSSKLRSMINDEKIFKTLKDAYSKLI